ncbi:MAG: hypothetical protein WC810_24655, partial [Janthinobacterium sp.]
MTVISVGGVPASPVTSGKVYFVDMKNGSDSASGKDSRYPLATIAAALALCVSGKGDVIYVMAPGENADGGESQTLTATVTIDKDAVSIVGIGANACPTGGAVGVAITNLDAFDVQADKVR